MWSEEKIAAVLRPVVERIFNNADEVSLNQAVQMLVDALRDLDAE